MCAWKYKRLMPRLTVDKFKLMEPTQIMGLVGMSVHHICSVLENMSYRAEISQVRTKGFSAVSLEDALLQNFIRTCRELMELSPKDVRSLLSAWLMKFEANCVKALLRAKEAELSVEEAMKYVTPVGSLNEARCRSILETSENVADVIDSLLDFEFGSVLEKVYDIYSKHKAFYLLEVALDRHVYHKIWGATGKFWGLDKKIAQTVIGLEIDSLNVKTVLRCKAMGIDPNQIKQYLVPASDVFTEERLQDTIKCSDMQSTLDSQVETAKRARARDHRIIFKELQELHVSSLTAVETVLDRGLLEANLRILKRYTPYFNIGLLLAYLNLKWFEVKNLRAILQGAEAGIASDRVKKLLVIQR